MNLKGMLRHVPDFPRKGVNFIDITTALQDPSAYGYIINCFLDELRDTSFDLVVSLEARGFIFGAPVAYAMNKGFIPIRKHGKLPFNTMQEKYSLEYREDILEIHVDAIKPGQKVVIIDDVFATGGTAKASINLIEKLGGVVSKVMFLAELDGLSSVKICDDYNVFSILKL